jgi:hypothetical protein
LEVTNEDVEKMNNEGFNKKAARGYSPLKGLREQLLEALPDINGPATKKVDKEKTETESEEVDESKSKKQ